MWLLPFSWISIKIFGNMNIFPVIHWGRTVLMLDPGAPHLCYSFFPASNDLLVSDLKPKRFSPRPRRVEHLSVCQGACGWKPTEKKKLHQLCVTAWTTMTGAKVPADSELCLLENFASICCCRNETTADTRNVPGVAEVRLSYYDFNY